ISAEEILATYFPGLTIGHMPAAKVTTDIIVSLPAGSEGEQQSITALAVRARDGLVRRLGTPKPDRLTLRLHPTIDLYQRATGRPWYTAGATGGGEIHFAPLAILRERGVLERTIRREIVRRLTGEALTSRPLWVREGIALYFADDSSAREASLTGRPVTNRRLSCPDDAELQRPQSPGALSNAYARASACVDRQISAGKRWTDVK